MGKVIADKLDHITGIGAGKRGRVTKTLLNALIGSGLCQIKYPGLARVLAIQIDGLHGLRIAKFTDHKSVADHPGQNKYQHPG